MWFLGEPYVFHLFKGERRGGASHDLAAPPKGPLAGALAPSL